MAEQQNSGQVIVSAIRRLLVGVLLFGIGVAVGLVGSRYDWDFFTPSYDLKVDLDTTPGIKVKSLVEINGFPVGRVWSIDLGPEGGKRVEVTLRIAKKYQSAIRADSRAKITSVGLFGDNFINITRGSPNQAILRANEVVKEDDTSASTFDCKSLTDLFAKMAGAFKIFGH